MKTLAERLKFAMENATPKKIKGVDLARAVGVKPPSVSDWLSGKSKTMEGENLLKAAKCLKVNASWLASGVGEMHPEISNDFYGAYVNSDKVLYGAAAANRRLESTAGLDELINKLIEMDGEGRLTKDFVKSLNGIVNVVEKAQDTKDQVANGTAPDTKSA